MLENSKSDSPVLSVILHAVPAASPWRYPVRFLYAGTQICAKTPGDSKTEKRTMCGHLHRQFIGLRPSSSASNGWTPLEKIREEYYNILSIYRVCAFLLLVDFEIMMYMACLGFSW